MEHFQLLRVAMLMQQNWTVWLDFQLAYHDVVLDTKEGNDLVLNYESLKFS